MKRRTFLTMLGLAPISGAVASASESEIFSRSAINGLTADDIDVHTLAPVTKTTHYLTVGDEFPDAYPGHSLQPDEVFYDWRKNEIWARLEGSQWMKLEWVK